LTRIVLVYCSNGAVVKREIGIVAGREGREVVERRKGRTR
jgi:hypothetical protein